MYYHKTPTPVAMCRQPITIKVHWENLVDCIAAAVDTALSTQVTLTCGVDLDDSDTEELTLSAEYETPYAEYQTEDGEEVIVRDTEFLDERAFRSAFRHEFAKRLPELSKLLTTDIEEDATQASYERS